MFSSQVEILEYWEMGRERSETVRMVHAFIKVLPAVLLNKHRASLRAIPTTLSSSLLWWLRNDRSLTQLESQLASFVASPKSPLRMWIGTH
jgi:hypothetical protein